VAFAQDQSSQNPTAEEGGAQIIVTAQRRAEVLQDVPMSVNVTTGEQLEKLAIFDFKDVQQLAAGLELNNNDGRTNVATLRGITHQPDSAASPAVDLYFNEIPVDAQSFYTAIYDIEQLEVLRGPQGIFRGRTSPAGSITLATRKANLDEPEGYVQFTATDRDAINGQGAVSVPLVPGKLALRFSALGDFNRVQQVRNITLDDKSRSTTMSGRLSLAFQPTERFKANLTYQYLWADSTPHIAVVGPGNAPYAWAAGLPGLDSTLGGPIDVSERSGPPLSLRDRAATSSFAPRFTNETQIVTLDAETELTDNIVWSFNGGYQNSKSMARRSLDFSNAVPNYVHNIQQVGDGRQGVETWTVDTRITSSGNKFFDWMFGGFYSHFGGGSPDPLVVTVAPQGFFGIGGLGPLPPSFPGLAPTPIDVTVLIDNNIRESKAVFGSARFNFTDKLHLEAGLRYTGYHNTNTSDLTVCLPTLGFCPLQNFVTASDRKYDALTGGANLIYEFNPDLTGYLAYGRSYRAGVTASGVTVPVSQDLVETDPETSDSFEVGLKASLFDRRLAVNISAFYQKFDGYIDYVPGLLVRDLTGTTGSEYGAIPTSTNGDAISKGVELQIYGRPTQNWDLGFNASYVDAHYDNAVMPCNTDNDGDGALDILPGQEVSLCTRNDRISQVPKFTASLNSEYRFQVGDAQPFIRGLVSYRPGFNSVLDNYSYRDITNVNLYVGVRLPNAGFEITAFAKNVLSQARALRSFYGAGQAGTTDITDPNFGPGPNFLSGYNLFTITPPREFGLTAKFSW